MKNQRKFMDDLAKRVHITDPKGWYKVTKAMIMNHGGAGLLRKYNGSPKKLVQSVFPEYQNQSLLLIHLCMSGTSVHSEHENMHVDTGIT